VSKYQPLWEYVSEKNADELILMFDEIASVCGMPIDHSFLTYKKELTAYGYEVGKISMKKQTVEILKRKNR